LFEKLVKEEDSNIDVEKYLKICEQLGEEPDPERMPLETSVFPQEVQVAFFVFNFMPDRWEGMSGSYMGKDWSSLEVILNIHEVEDRVVVVYLIKLWESVIVSYRAEKAESKRKRDERKSKSGEGKNYTHNVKG
jgi:hypothetical protein